MPVINMPPELKIIMGDLDKRVRKLEQSPPKRPYGLFYDITNQTAPSSASVYAVAIGSTLASNMVSIVGGNKITVERTGIYNIQFSLAFKNSAAQATDVQIWFRHNTVDEPYSNTDLTVPPKKGSVNGAAVAAWNFLIEMNATDYIQLMWWNEASTVTMPTLGPFTAPVRPYAPSAIVSVVEEAW